MTTGPCVTARPFSTSRHSTHTGRPWTPSLRPDAAPRPGTLTPRTSGTAGSSGLASRPGRRKSQHGLRPAPEVPSAAVASARAAGSPSPPSARAGSPESARAAGAEARGDPGSAGARLGPRDCVPGPREAGARLEARPEGPSRGRGGAGRAHTGAAHGTHGGGLPWGSRAPTGSHPSARAVGGAGGRPAPRAPRGPTVPRAALPRAAETQEAAGPRGRPVEVELLILQLICRG